MDKVVCRWLLATVLMLSSLVVLVGCDEADMALIMSFADEWARAKNINPANPDGSPNPEGIKNILIRQLGGSTGDEQADAAIDAGSVIDNLKEADKLNDEGRYGADLAKIDKAIEKRPQDYTYRNSRGLALLTSNDQQGSLSAFAQADQLAASQGRRAQIWNLVDRINTLASALGGFAYAGKAFNIDLFAEQYCRDARAYQQLTGDDKPLKDSRCTGR